MSFGPRHNWVQHIVQDGVCVHCHESFLYNGVVYHKAESRQYLKVTPVKFSFCTERM